MMLQKQILHTANYLHKKLQVFMAIFCTKIFFFFQKRSGKRMRHYM